MNVKELTEVIINNESFKVKPLNINSFSVEFSEIDKTITLFVNHRKMAVLHEKTIDKYDELLTAVNKLIHSWRVQ